MKIIQANKFHRPQGGCETVYFSEIDGLRRNGFDVAEFAMKESGTLKSEYESFFSEEVVFDNISFVSKVKASSKIIYNFNSKSMLDKLISDFSPDLFHAHNIYHQLSPSIFDVTYKRNIPSVLTSHDLKLACPNYKMYSNNKLCTKCLNGSYWQCTVNKCSKGSVLNSAVNSVEAYVHKYLKIYKKIDKIICPSMFNAQMLIKAGYSEDKISILPNGINLDEHIPCTEKEGYILYVGRITKDKGVGEILNVAMRLPNIKFMFVGDGPDRALFESMSIHCSNISFLGFKNKTNVNELISKSNAVIVSSLLYENCPMAVLEAMALGKIVIASNIGGIPEIISHEINGFLYDNNNVNSLMELVVNVIDNPNDLSLIEIEARRTIEEKYTEKVHIKNLIEIYKALV